MAETTNIEWADATLNFWIGCTAVSNGKHGACVFCYAEVYGKRFGVKWGPGEDRRKTVDCLKKAMVLERKAIKLGRPLRCFSNSLSDIFDNEVPIEWLREAFDIMRATPHVIYLLLTKRAPNIEKRALEAGGLPDNVALGCTVVTQSEANRDVIWLLRAASQLGALFAFVSCEPLMGEIDFFNLDLGNNRHLDAFAGVESGPHGAQSFWKPLGWVIAGGESGPHARPTHVRAIRGLRDQCASISVPFLFKQWGEFIDADQPGIDMLGTERSPMFEWEDGKWSVRIGKTQAGRMLDGRTHDERPDASVCAS